MKFFKKEKKETVEWKIVGILVSCLFGS